MAIVKDVYMKSAEWALLFIGLAHLQFESIAQKRLYRAYKFAVAIYFGVFVITQIIDIPMVYKTGKYDELMNNLSVTILYISSITKFRTLLKPEIASLVTYVRKVERAILDGVDETMKTIFHSYRVYNNHLSNFILFMGAFTISFWFVNPFLTYLDWSYSEHPANETHEWTYSFGSWFPFDKQTHYWVAYGFQVIDGTYGAAITVIPDAILWSFMTFVLMDLDILVYKVQHIPRHVSETMYANPFMSEKQAYRIVLNKCIFLHQHIIKFVKNLDDAMNVLMFLDFMIGSLQIGVCCMRILFSTGEVLMLFSAFEYLCGVVMQMMLFYWHANEILVKSEGISMSIYQSDWYNYSNDIKLDLQFMMLRAQSPLLLNIGPFYYMSTSTAIGILKAAYSYIALMRQFYT